MSLRLLKIIGTFIIFLLCFPFHFLYDWFSNALFSFIFPVNESIWEHMKLLLFPFVFYTTIEYLFNKRKINNIYLQLFIVPIISIFLYLILYLPIFNVYGENMIFSISLLFVIILFGQIISYYLSKCKKIKYQKPIGLVGVIMVIIIFICLTYNPPKTMLFLDNTNDTYGVLKIP